MDQSAERRRVAADLFYRPGGATMRSVKELYDVIELDPDTAVISHEVVVAEPQWQQSA
jgi:hypothetical protein